MLQSIQQEAESFARTYGSFWDTPDSCSYENHRTVATNAGRCYTSGCTILTNAEKSTLEVRSLPLIAPSKLTLGLVARSSDGADCQRNAQEYRITSRLPHDSRGGDKRRL